jgi:hypothetical protein
MKKSIFNELLPLYYFPDFNTFRIPLTLISISTWFSMQLHTFSHSFYTQKWSIDLKFTRNIIYLHVEMKRIFFWRVRNSAMKLFYKFFETVTSFLWKKIFYRLITTWSQKSSLFYFLIFWKIKFIKIFIFLKIKNDMNYGC